MSANNASHWGKFPLWWLPALRGKSTAMAVAVVLSKHADPDTGEAFPSQATMAQLTGVHRNRIIDAIECLIEAGIITERSRRGPKSNRYIVRYDAPKSGESPKLGDAPKLGALDAPDSGALDAPDPRHKIRPLKRPLKSPAAAEEQFSTADDETLLRSAWASQSPQNYPGVRNWEAFVQSQIRRRNMPEPGSKTGLRIVAQGDCSRCPATSVLGFKTQAGFFCHDCSESQRPTYCGFGCIKMHYPWEPCGAVNERDLEGL